MEIKKTAMGFVRSDCDITFPTRGLAKQWQPSKSKVRIVEETMQNPVFRISQQEETLDDESTTTKRQQDSQEPKASA